MGSVGMGDDGGSKFGPEIRPSPTLHTQNRGFRDPKKKTHFLVPSKGKIVKKGGPKNSAIRPGNFPGGGSYGRWGRFFLAFELEKVWEIEITGFWPKSDDFFGFFGHFFGFFGGQKIGSGPQKIEIFDPQTGKLSKTSENRLF